MHLVDQALAGCQLPDALPDALIPPSSVSVSVSANALVSSSVTPPVSAPMNDGERRYIVARGCCWDDVCVLKNILVSVAYRFHVFLNLIPSLCLYGQAVPADIRWVVSLAEKKMFDQYFSVADKNGDGIISGTSSVFSFCSLSFHAYCED